MWVIRYHTPGKRPPSGRTWFATCAADWVRVRVKGESSATTGAHVPDDHPDREHIGDIVRGFASTAWLADDRVELLSAVGTGGGPVAPPAPVVELEDPLRDMLYMRKIALTNGWDDAELAGTGYGGDPGPHGGRSPLTGLTLVESTLTRPPIDWEQLLANGRPPWESTDWSVPAPGWVHPSWPEKAPPVEKPPTAPGEAPAGESVSSDPEVPDLDLPPPAADPVVPDAEAGTPADPEADPLAGYPPEHAAAARVIVIDLQERKGGAVPHFNAVGFFLKKENLPKINAAQILALIATAPPKPPASST